MGVQCSSAWDGKSDFSEPTTQVWVPGVRPVGFALA
jgi:hypothetical protein